MPLAPDSKPVYIPYRPPPGHEHYNKCREQPGSSRGNISDNGSAYSGQSKLTDSGICMEYQAAVGSSHKQSVSHSPSSNHSVPESAFDTSGPRRLADDDIYCVPGSVPPDRWGEVEVRSLEDLLKPRLHVVNTLKTLEKPDPKVQIRYYSKPETVDQCPPVVPTIDEILPLINEELVAGFATTPDMERRGKRSLIGSSKLSSPKSAFWGRPRGFQLPPVSREPSIPSLTEGVYGWLRKVGSPPPTRHCLSPTPTNCSTSSQQGSMSKTDDKGTPVSNPPLILPIPVPSQGIRSSLNERYAAQQAPSSARSVCSPVTLQKRRDSTSSAGSWFSCKFKRGSLSKEEFIPQRREAAAQSPTSGIGPSIVARSDKQINDLDEWGYRKGTAESVAGLRGFDLSSSGYEASERYWQHLKDSKIYPAYIPDDLKSKLERIISRRSTVRKMFFPRRVRDSFRQRGHSPRKSSYDQYRPRSPAPSSCFSFDPGASRRDSQVKVVPDPQPVASSVAAPEREDFFEGNEESGFTPIDRWLQEGLPRSRYQAREILPDETSSIMSAGSGRSGKTGSSVSTLSSRIKRKLVPRPNGKKIRKKKSHGSNPYGSEASDAERTSSGSAFQRSSHVGSTRSMTSMGGSIKSSASFWSEKARSVFRLRQDGDIKSSHGKSNLSKWFKKICPEPKKRLQKKRLSAKGGGFRASRLSVKPG